MFESGGNRVLYFFKVKKIQFLYFESTEAHLLPTDATEARAVSFPTSNTERSTSSSLIDESWNSDSV